MVLNVILAIFALYLLYTILRGAPFLPSKNQSVKTMVNLCEIKPGEKAADLGAGDGRVVIALALAGAEAHGYESNLFLVWWGRRNIKKAGLAGQAHIHWRSFWGVDLSEFRVITVFGIDHIMERLGHKLRRELLPGARVASNLFGFPNWTEHLKIGQIFLYKRP